MKYYTTIILIFFVIHQAIPQTNHLSIKNSHWSGLHYYIDKYKVDKSEFKYELTKNPEAFSVYKSGKKKFNWASVISYVGGSAIGWTIGDLILRKEKPNYLFGILGLGLIYTAIPLEEIGIRKMKKAIDIYNLK
ncbi:MAG: hypothetical protein ABIO44_00565 [Saprospiraceae bacterium]